MTCMAWEYRIELLHGDPESQLNKLGAEEWELVSVVQLERYDTPRVYLKRRKQQILPFKTRSEIEI